MNKAAKAFSWAMTIVAGMVLMPPAGMAQQKTELRVAYIPVVTWLPMLIANDTGVFEKNGLAVTLTKFPNITNLPQTLPC